MSKYFFQESQIVTNGSMTGTSVIHSPAMDVRSMSLASFQAVWTGTPNGTFAMEGSVDGSTFSDLNVTITAATGSAGNRLVNFADMGFPWIRMSYTNTSSTGTLNIFFSAKGA